MKGLSLGVMEALGLTLQLHCQGLPFPVPLNPLSCPGQRSQVPYGSVLDSGVICTQQAHTGSFFFFLTCHFVSSFWSIHKVSGFLDFPCWCVDSKQHLPQFNQGEGYREWEQAHCGRQPLETSGKEAFFPRLCQPQQASFREVSALSINSVWGHLKGSKVC